jgi:hypothetical protein
VAQYVFKRARGVTPDGTSDVAPDAGAVDALDGLRVLDAVGEVGLLVEAQPGALERHRLSLRGWAIHPVVEHPLPGRPDPTRGGAS